VKYQVRGLIRLADRAPEWFLRASWEPFGSRLLFPAPKRLLLPADGTDPMRTRPSS